MTKPTAGLGTKVRSMRRARALTQVELARRLGISASYLNLIEHGQRALTAPLMRKLAKQLEYEIDAFTPDADQHLAAAVAELFTDGVFDGQRPSTEEIDELVSGSPAVARGLVRIFRAYQEARASADGLATQIYDEHERLRGVSDAPLASEEVSDFIQRRGNYFGELEDAAVALRARLGLPTDDPADAGLARDQLFPALREHLGRAHDIEVELNAGREGHLLRGYDPHRRVLTLSDAMPPGTRVFQTAAQVGLIELSDVLERVLDDPAVAAGPARALGRVVLANYFAAAVLMPYTAFLAAAKRERYDIDLLGNRFGASFEQVCHRLTSLQHPGAEGIRFHMIRVDLAGNISKRFSASGIRFARFAGACPRWNVFSAFLAPGAIRVQLSRMPDQEVYFCVARTVPKGRGGYRSPHTVQAVGLGCRLEDARDMIYADGVDLDEPSNAVPIGITCRLCERRDCEQRAFPSIRDLSIVDENRRGPSFWG